MDDYDNLSPEQLTAILRESKPELDDNPEVSGVGELDATLPENSTLHQILFENLVEEVHLWKVVRDSEGNIQTWQLVDINPSAERSWGVKRAEVIGKTADEIFTTATELFMPIVQKAFSEDKAQSWEEYFPDLDQILKMTTVPFGEYFISTGTDITEIKRAQNEAKQANQAKSEFLAAMSHELRTPLNAILGYSQMLQMGTFGKLLPKQKEMVGVIVDGGTHLLHLVDDVLDLARIESNQLNLNVEAFDANGVINDCVKWIDEKCAKRRIRIENSFAHGPRYNVRSDRRRLAQVVANLLSNAEKYNVDGGVITIGGIATEREYLRISVSDTGSGIDPSSGDRIFELFDRGVDRPEVAGGGVGIGLAVSRSIIERLGGWIDYKSTLGEGSEFWITVPLSDNEDVLIWTDDLRVGIDEIDKDHQEIFALTNLVSRKSLDSDQIGAVIQQMIAYTRYHFSREEVIMQVAQYPDFVEHCSGHRKLEDQVQNLVASWRRNPSTETRHDLQHFLRDWWRNHILAGDMSISRHAAGKAKTIREELAARGLGRPP